MNNCKLTRAQAMLDQATHGALDISQINELAEIINKLLINADDVDMLVDEITRIKCVTGCNQEIKGLCERALSKTRRTLSIYTQYEQLKESTRDTVSAEKLLKVLYYAPNSPLPAQKASDVERWYFDNIEAIRKLKD